MERGDFDNLPGKGKPLNLVDDPLLDPMTAIVHRILREEGLSHPLIEARKAMAAEADQCRAELGRAWRAYQHSQSAEAWTDAVHKFRDRVKEINRQVRIFNLKAPSPVFHGLVLDADAEVERICQCNPRSAPTSK